MQDFIKIVDGGQLLTVRQDALTPSDTDSVSPEQVPGLLLFGEQPLYRVGSKLFPVLGCVRRDGRYVPVLDIPQADEDPAPAETEEGSPN